MKPIAIDFARRAGVPVKAWQAVAVLLAALAAGSAARNYIDYGDARDAWMLAQAEASVSADPATGEGRTAAQDAVTDQIKQLDKLHAALATPWEQMFRAVEAVPADGIAVLEMSSDADSRDIVLGAMARDVRAMQAYTQALGSPGSLAGVHLASHQVQPQDGQAPVRFSIMANWRAGVAP